MSDQQQAAEEKVTAANQWFEDVIAAASAVDAADPMPPYREPERMWPLNLTKARGTFTTDHADSIRDCAHCTRAIHVGRQRVGHRPTKTSTVTHYYHPECVVTP